MFIQSQLIFFSLQIVNKCSNKEELSFFDHQSTLIRPVTILLEVGQTILIGGVARIDVKHVCLFDDLHSFSFIFAVS